MFNGSLIGPYVRKNSNKFGFSLTYSYLCSQIRNKYVFKEDGKQDLQAYDGDVGAPIR